MIYKKLLQVIFVCFLLSALLISSSCNNQTKALGEENLVSTNELTEEEALLLIHDKVEENKEKGLEGLEYTTRDPFHVVEISIPDLYEKMQVVAYQAYTKEDVSAGTYLIHDGRVYPIVDSLENTCVADIDQNGTYELLSLFGFGSGIYRIHLNVYQYGIPFNISYQKKVLHLNYQNIFVPNNGYGQLAFHKISDTEVHLVEQDKEKDYGSLKIAEDGHHIVPSKLNAFPYDQWNNEFTFSSAQQALLNEIPTMHASVGDTKLMVVGSKKDWNGEQEEAIPFADLMQLEIPCFPNPKELFEYDQEICLSFDDVVPSNIQVFDSLLSKEGKELYSTKEKLERAVRVGEDGNYYVGLTHHIALMLSSDSSTYENPSYRGFQVICEFDGNQVCSYQFVLSLEPMWKQESN